MSASNRLGRVAAAVLALLAIADLPAATARPQAPPGGYWIVIASDRDGQERGYSLRPDGSRLTPLLAPARPPVPRLISRDGGTIVYYAGDGLYVSRANGSGLRRLVSDGRPDAISRDGRVVAIDRNTELWIIGTNGRGLRRLTPGPIDEATDWSPDARSLAVTERRDAGPRVVVRRLDGGRRILAPLGSSGAKWSPDGRWIAYTLDEKNRSVRDGLYIVRPNGGRARRIVRGEISGSGFAWSPDTRRVAVMSGGGDVTLVGVDGRVLRRVRLPKLGSGRLSWSPDGRLLAVTSGFFDERRLSVVDVVRNRVRRLTRTGEVVGWTTQAPIRPPAGPLLPSERVVDDRTVATRGPVRDLSGEGGRVALAVATRTDADCEHVVVWTPSNRDLRRFGRPAPCGDDDSGAIYSPELAGSRAAWSVVGGCGNFCDVALESAALGGRPASLGLAHGVLDAGRSGDDDYYRVRGDQDVLVFNDGARLVRIGAGRERCSGGEARAELCTTLRRGAHSAPVESVSGGLIAIREADGVAVLDATGALVRVFPFGRGQVTAARLDGRHLVVARARTLEVYDARTGAAEFQRPLPTDFRLTDVDDGVAVLRQRATVMLLRLADGRSFTMSPGREPVSADLESAGLYYAYATADGSGRAVFVPRAEVVGRLQAG